jgi:hypothetical protein
MVLDVLGVVCARSAEALNAGQPVTDELLWLALGGFLAWRVWRHGRMAWVVLLILTAAFLPLVPASPAWPFPLDLVGIFAIPAAQTVLLLSPAIRRHVRAKSQP